MLFRSYSLVVLFLLAVAVPAQAQEDAPIDTTVVAEDPPTTRDIRLLHAVYDIEAPAFAATMRGADWSSLKTFYLGPPALWLGTLAFGDGDYEPAYLLTLSEVGTVGTVFALKNIIRRPRPYVSLSDIASRSQGFQDEEVFDPHSFPSGHAAASFTIATSLSLSFPEWYVVAPAYLWATAVTLSRMWLGVHYPTDVAVGAALGTGVAFGVHALSALITPDGLRGGGDADPPPVVRFVVPL